MRFPRGQLILFSVKGDFVNFDGVLSVPKKLRAFRKSMVMTVDYPDVSDVLFFKKGELYRILRKISDSFQEITLEKVKEKIEKTDTSIVNMFFIEDSLMDLIITGFKKEKAEEVDGGITDVEDYMKRLQQEGFSGFIVVTFRDEYSYVLMVEGRFLHVFLANNKTGIDDLWHYLRERKENIRLWVFNEIPSETQYATSSQIDLIFNSMERVLREFGNILGPNIVLRLVDIVKRNIVKEFTFFENINFNEDLRIKGDVRVEVDILVKGFASFLNQLIDSLAPLSAGRHMEVLKNALKDYRFALSELGFFEFFKYKLDW